MNPYRIDGMLQQTVNGWNLLSQCRQVLYLGAKVHLLEKIFYQ